MHGRGNVEENYAKPWHKAWPTKSRRELCQGGGGGWAPRQEEEKICQAMRRGIAAEKYRKNMPGYLTKYSKG